VEQYVVGLVTPRVTKAASPHLEGLRRRWIAREQVPEYLETSEVSFTSPEGPSTNTIYSAKSIFVLGLQEHAIPSLAPSARFNPTAFRRPLSAA
jgi:hypothetical protein